MSNAKNATKKQSSSPQRESHNPWPRRLGIGAGVVVVGLLVATVFLNSPPMRGVPDGTETVDVGERQHVEGDIHAEGEVPAGGPHSAVWQNCGFYEDEIRSENAVHSLEHGAVWITYRADLPSGDIESLRGLIRNPDKILISPMESQESPVVATAWANQLELQSVSDPSLPQFINEFEGSRSAPEPGGSCNGGVGTPAG